MVVEDGRDLPACTLNTFQLSFPWLLYLPKKRNDGKN